MDCFTQLVGIHLCDDNQVILIQRPLLQLLVMEALQQSGNQEYKDVSEILQDKLYYEGQTLDMVIQIASTYKNQPIRYLDTVINLVYVLLRMLEKYSKNKEHMFVKKKARRRANRNGGELLMMACAY